MKRSLWLVLLVVAAAMAIQLSPPLGALLIFDRGAIGAGEHWRLVTASAVHFSWMHLLGDAAVLLAAGWMLRERPRAEVIALLLGSAVAGSAAVLLFSPELRWYGGLSGVAHAMVVYVALLGMREHGTHRWLACLTLFVVASKLMLDAGTVRLLAGAHLGSPVVVAEMSHRGAVAFAVLLSILTVADHAEGHGARLQRALEPHPRPHART
jgi:rhomboid family GlyGly-CTERM serine protease